MGFTTRTYNTLDRHGIKTAECLPRYDSRKIIKIRNLSYGSLGEVTRKMREFGYRRRTGEIEKISRNRKIDRALRN